MVADNAGEVTKTEEAQTPKTEAYRSARGVMQVCMLFLGGSIAVAILAVSFDLSELHLLGRIERFEFVTRAEIEASDSRQGIIGIVGVVAALITGIPFIIWFHRMYGTCEPSAGTSGSEKVGR
jgi:hypothetical protein